MFSNQSSSSLCSLANITLAKRFKALFGEQVTCGTFESAFIHKENKYYVMYVVVEKNTVLQQRMQHAFTV